ncbi:MAG: 13E12 repeat family protein, partial [Actinobacteria bacterium]|nr:13E12 repeat family protein [Actinomycetota bacterium]
MRYVPAWEHPGRAWAPTNSGAAAAQLLREAPDLTLERLAARARELRSELDLDGVADREAQLRSRRYLHLTPQADGMTRLSGLLDPESAATVVATFDAATSP